MKRYTLYLLMAFTIVLMYACSHDTTPNEASNEESVSNVTIKIPEDIFDSNKKNENINEEEMKESIKNYLDYSHALTENIFSIYDENVTESDREKLQKLIGQAKKNDANFKDYISDNKIPDEYKQPSKDINEFVSSVVAVSLELDQEIDKIFQKGSLTDISNFASKHFTKANGRKQKEIEKFLNKKNIKTTYFD
ncbi:NDxxF motif lipoprotein [Heyndrickxia sporothermodurans]